MAVLTAMTVAADLSAADGNWWTADVWKDPDRPFLFYGEDKTPEKRSAPNERKPDEAEKPASPQTQDKTPSEKPVQNIRTEPKPVDPDDFSRFTTIESLKAEREARLSAAVMNPSPENMRRYQAVNAHMLALSARFAEAWQLGRFTSPQYDWTASHPSANFVTASLAETRLQNRTETLSALGSDLGILFIARPGDPLTPLAAGPLRAFARTYGLDVLASAAGAAFSGKRSGKDVPGFEAFDDVQSDGGRAEALGIRVLPAVVLIPRPEAVLLRPDFSLMKGALSGRDGIVIASGAVSAEELARRISLLLDAGKRHANPSGSSLPQTNTAINPHEIKQHQ